MIVYRSAAAVGRAPALEAWADASFANDLCKGSTLLAKSRSGLLVHVYGALLYASSQRQTSVALSTCEAETTAHALATRVIIPIHLTMAVLGYNLPAPTTIHCSSPNSETPQTSLPIYKPGAATPRPTSSRRGPLPGHSPGPSQPVPSRTLASFLFRLAGSADTRTL